MTEIAAGNPYAELEGGETRRLSLSLGVVLAIHAVALIAFVGHTVPMQPVPVDPPAVILDLPPLPQPVPPPPLPPPPPPPETVKPLPKSEVALPDPPKPKPRPKLVKPPPPVEQPPVAQPQPVKPPPIQPAPAPVAPPSQAIPTWQALLLGRLEQYKQYPRLAREHKQQGMATIRFVMDRQGNVLSARLDKSSGYDLLDAEALALPERARPLPAPPPEITDSQIEITVPVRFFLQPH